MIILITISSTGIWECYYFWMQNEIKFLFPQYNLYGVPKLWERKVDTNLELEMLEKHRENNINY